MAKITDSHEQIIDARLEAGESLRSIARDLGVTYQTLQYHRRKWGKAKLRDGYMSGKDHPSWTGGRYIDRWGYTMIRTPERDQSNPYVAEHILVAEQKLGRQLEKYKEVVHHINGDKTDNRPVNLLVCDRSHHRTLHRQLETIGYELIKRGWVVYKNGEYILVV